MARQPSSELLAVSPRGRPHRQWFFDGSLWEKSQRTNDNSLKALIRSGLDGTSATCVLAGAKTYYRRWVRYEIAQSVIRGNGLLTVHIDWLKDKDGNFCSKGPNPLDSIGVYKKQDGRVYFAERNSAGAWVEYGDYTLSVDLPKNWAAPSATHVTPISNYCFEYCYVNGDGANNLASWIDLAARNVGR